MEQWAAEADCPEITMGGREAGDFQLVWIISSSSALGLILLLVVPVICCTRKRKKKPTEEEKRSAEPARRTVKEDIQRTAPDREAAQRHLKSSSATIDGQWLSPCWTDTDKISQIGGTGTELYFNTLRSLGIIFAIMAALTFPTTAFCLLGTFAPDNGQFLVRASIGNLGLLADTSILDPLHRIVRVGCDGAELSDLTSIFAWMDFASMVILFLYLLRHRMVEIPRRTAAEDMENVSVQDFSVVVEGLPARIDNQTDYARLLTEHLNERMKTMHKGGEIEPQVASMTLVRDFGGRLESIQDRARMLQNIEVLKAYGRTKAVERAEASLEKLDAKLKAQLAPDEELPVLRAYVILNRVADAESLLYDYRLANFKLFRCCQAAPKRFKGNAIRVRPAPQPSNILWENQDTPWWSRLLRQCCILLTFILILIISLVLIYVITVVGKAEAGEQLSYIGHPLCDPKMADESQDSYICFVGNASNWTRTYAVEEGGDILNCWCEAQGYAKLIEDTSLVETCSPWFLETARGIGIMTAASCVVVGINLVLQLVIISMARFERPLSLTALNHSMMQKIFVAQTLNTGFVLFIVNTYGPKGLRDFVSQIPVLGPLLFEGPFEDLTRAWYAAVGATIMTNMVLNMVVPPMVTVAKIFVTWVKRRCCRGRVKHHSELITLYTNPEFDIKAKYAQMLTTVFVTLTYSAGLPLLYLFAMGFMACMYWADKFALLWCSKRPPAYDSVLAKESTEKMMYAIALHCVFAVVMFGQPCVFPSQPLGGQLGALVEQGAFAGEYLGVVWEKMTQESTWMFVALFALLLVFWVFWWLRLIFSHTFGTFGHLMWQLCCASHKSKDGKTGKVDIAETMTWAEAHPIIERTSPPASYEMSEHPDMVEIAHLMKATYKRDSGVDLNPSNPEDPSGLHRQVLSAAM